MMMTFCKKSVHSFLGGLSNSCLLPPPPQPPSSSSPPCNKGLGLITSAHRTPNVVESASIVKSPPPPHLTDLTLLGRCGGGGGGDGFVDGLTSCTESLGFESCDERRVDDDERNHHKNSSNNNVCSTAARSGGGGGDGEIGDGWSDRIKERRRKREARKVKTFPPPISSLNKNGQPSFFLRPVRRDGRLELTEVRIDRPEVLRASREDGRLRLLLVRDNNNNNNNDKIDGDDCTTDNDVSEGDSIAEEEESLDAIEEEEKTTSYCAGRNSVEEEEEREEKESSSSSSWSSEEKEEGMNGELWRSNDNDNVREEWSYSPVNGEGFRRCYDLLSHRSGGGVGGGGHYYHGGDMHMWRQHCVTTR